MKINEPSIEKINTSYEVIMYNQLYDEYYSHSDFFNWGYWGEKITSPVQASENLMEKLLEFIPEKRGSILDIACGKGASSRYLLKYYCPNQITGINISEKQLDSCRKNAPNCTFILADAVKSGLPDNEFENIICVEAAFHFDTRERFIQEAYRMLKPGGNLVLSDILFKRGRVGDPKTNYLQNLTLYKKLFTNNGFIDVEIHDATSESWQGHHKEAKKWFRNWLLCGRINDMEYLHLTTKLSLIGKSLKHYLLVSSKKPVF